MTSGNVSTASQTFETAPVCARNVPEFGYAVSDEHDNLPVITAHRVCDDFISWVPALSPKEHIEMMLREEQREYHRQLQQEEREWREMDREERAKEAAALKQGTKRIDARLHGNSGLVSHSR